MTRSAPRVLVVDDDQDLLDLVAMLLSDEDLDVATASQGAEALERIDREGPPDLVLLDLKMPVMDGAAFARQFRARHGAKTPIVVFTAAVDARRRDELQAAAWLAKPFDLDRLVATVRGLLGS